MRVLLGLAALAAAVNAQTVSTDTATGVTVPNNLVSTGPPLVSFVIWQTAVNNVLATVDPVAAGQGLTSYVSNSFLAQGNWNIRVPNAISTLVYVVTTNNLVAQLGYRYSGTTYAAAISSATAGGAVGLDTQSYQCDPCAGGTFTSCNKFGPGTGTSPAAGFACASLTRRYTYTGLLASTATVAALNNFAIQAYDRSSPTPIVNTFAFTLQRLAPAILGDPQINGMQGQDFQVHGVPDEVFNMITYPNLQINARFVYLSSAECVDNYTACFAHPGTYISEEGIRLGADKIHVRAGSAKKGLTVSVNGQKVVAAKTNVKLGSVEVVNHRRVVIKTPIMAISITNSDKFLNQETQLFDRKLLALGSERRVLADSEKFHPEVPLHGLQGQTWRNVEYPSGLDYEGSISDYQIQDGNLFGTNFVFNQFSQ